MDGQYELTFTVWVETTDVGGPGARDPQRVAGAGRVLRGLGKLDLQVLYGPRHDRVWEEDRAPAEAAGPVGGGFRHAPAPRLPVAGLVRAGDGRRASAGAFLGTS